MSRRRRYYKNSYTETSSLEDIGLLFTGLFSKDQRGKYDRRTLEKQLNHERRILAEDKLRHLSPTQFELFISHIFQLKGYRTYVRGGSGDHGVDIEARCSNEYAIIQCKHYFGNAVKPTQVRDLGGAIHREKANKGIFVTSGFFTQQSYDWAEGQPIELVDLEGIISWLKIHKIGPWYEEEKPTSVITSVNSIRDEVKELLYPSRAVLPAQSEVTPSTKVIPFPTRLAGVSSQPSSLLKRGWSTWQWLVILILTSMACVVGCGVCAVVGSLTPPQSQAIVSLPTTPPKPSLEGVIFTVIGSKLFEAQDKIIKPSGHFWLVEVAIHNPTDKTIQVNTYNIFLKDQQNREIWYHHDLTYLYLKNPVTADLNPGQTVQVSLVYDVPTDVEGELSLNYNGGMVLFQLK